MRQEQFILDSVIPIHASTPWSALIVKRLLVWRSMNKVY